MKKAIILLAIVLLAGYAVGPDYKRPELDIPQSFRFEEKEAKNLANTAWWQQFDDPVLNDLIQIAIQENKDLKIATARIGQFVGQLHDNAGGFLSSGGGRSQRRNGTAHGEGVILRSRPAWTSEMISGRFF